MTLPRHLTDPPAPYVERGTPVDVLLGWTGHSPRNVLIRRPTGEHVVRPFRSLRRPLVPPRDA